MAHDVFISYSSHDKPAADAICAKLESRRIRCWIAPRDIPPGAGWGGAIIESIDASRVMLLLFSSNANKSPQIKREVEHAVHKEIVIVPVRVEDVMPTGDFEYFLGTPHWLDAITPPFEQHLDQVADSVAFWLKRDIGDGVIAGVAGVPGIQPAHKADAASDGKAVANVRRFAIAMIGLVAITIAIFGMRSYRAYTHRQTLAKADAVVDGLAR
ncbi:MAG TPA: toll/interleukin-1 receptor domain-containing protein, partial [Candidatus Binataceae bacterium]|nr:toll/interleukin-1 receptor domain-containing protein [Candidatus Binataceae bacterium]